MIGDTEKEILTTEDLDENERKSNKGKNVTDYNWLKIVKLCYEAGYFILKVTEHGIHEDMSGSDDKDTLSIQSTILTFDLILYLSRDLT